MLKNYLKKITEIAIRGDDREESYYSTLESVLLEYVNSTSRSHIKVTMLPKKTEAGNPDFRLWDGTQHIIGYIEAKAPTKTNLDDIEDTEQLRRYLHTFPNLILTNFFEFRFYRNGTLIDSVQIAKPFIIFKLKKTPPVENEQKFFELLEKFLSFSIPKVYDARTLAVELAKRTRFLRQEVVAQELQEEDSEAAGILSGFFEAFRKYLIAGLTPEEFADLYSQTITYGLFAARTRSENSFNRKLAYDYIPQTIGILKDIFQFISLGKLPPQMEWIIDDISEVLAVTDVKKILHDYFYEGKGSDPIVHFYETFLAEYDPKTREKRGVYYTPEPVVSYIVRSLNFILRKYFDRPDGLASQTVTVLDPAAGTLTFLAEAAKLAVKEFVARYGDGAKAEFIRDHILKNFYAFELMMAPYAVGHLKMSFLLEEIGYKLQKDERFKLYLTNTLEMEELAQSSFPGMASLSEESHLAGKVKKETPILVIMGNPPYSGHSANKGKWITDLLKESYVSPDGHKDEGYYRVDGQPLGEKNPKWLQDDYVKFIRFAQWKIDQMGEGVIGFITNHSYLDNPTFRGMRQSLMRSFNEIYVLDLHGNSLKKERCPDGGKDENVFDIMQGVAIVLFIKKKGEKQGSKVYHSELWGLRENKYEWLRRNDISTTQWTEIFPKYEFYLFIPRDEMLLKKYDTFLKINNIFPVNSVGIVTARDNLTIKWSPEEVWTTILNFSRMDPELARQAYNLGKDARDWKVELAQKDLIESGLDKRKIVPILYRPFDIRYTYYTGMSRGFICRPRPEVMKHMMRENLGLITVRQVAEGVFNHAFVGNSIIESRITLSNKGIGFIFPLYFYHSSDKKDLFIKDEEIGKREPNISPKVLQALSEAYKKQPSPEEIFYYIYAVLYSNVYRQKYAEFLKMDFPRVPFTKNYRLFSKMASYGNELVELHLLKSPELELPSVKFQGVGDNQVEVVRYENNRVYINKSQYFESVPENIWQYQIGGYQVCEKWLKERKERKLSLEDIKHYCKMVAALEKTIAIQNKIDEIYSQAEESLVESS
ncbi:MAG TPA: N-6 DNA methylase [Candidatus Saccharicenans sp.]|nr:N-6 DNA methylase [Candidatus Saccharicenans sp.]